VPQTDEPCGPPPAIDTSARQFRGNLVANLIVFIAGTALGLWYTPFLIDRLGVAVYGFVPLAGEATMYVGILTGAIGVAIGRFISLSVGAGKLDAASSYLSTGFLVIAALAALLAPGILALAWFGAGWLQVPEGSFETVRSYFVLMAAVFLIGLPAGPISATCSATNRLDLLRVADFIGRLLSVAVVVLLFRARGPNLVWVATGAAVGIAYNWGRVVVLWRRLLPQVRLRVAHARRAMVREVLSFSGWLTVNQMGWVVFQFSDLLVLNILAGPLVAGIYAPLLQVSSYLRNISHLATSAISPTLVIRHGQGDTNSTVRLAIQGAKLLGLAMALPIGLFCGLAEPLLRLWVGDRFTSTAPLAWLIAAPLVLAFATNMYGNVYIAVGRVKVPGIVSVLRGLTALGLSILLVGPFEMAALGVSIARAVAVLSLAVLYQPWYAARVTQRPTWPFYAGLVGAAVALLATGGAATAIASLPLSDWATVGLGLAAGGFAWVAIALSPLGLNREDRRLIGALLSRGR
jgi:O-antigen/teichoic acid export membrane protein